MEQNKKLPPAHTLVEAFAFLSDYDAPLFFSWCNDLGMFL